MNIFMDDNPENRAFQENISSCITECSRFQSDYSDRMMVELKSNPSISNLTDLNFFHFATYDDSESKKNEIEERAASISKALGDFITFSKENNPVLENKEFAIILYPKFAGSMKARIYKDIGYQLEGESFKTNKSIIIMNYNYTEPDIKSLVEISAHEIGHIIEAYKNGTKNGYYKSFEEGPDAMAKNFLKEFYTNIEGEKLLIEYNKAKGTNYSLVDSFEKVLERERKAEAIIKNLGLKYEERKPSPNIVPAHPPIEAQIEVLKNFH